MDTVTWDERYDRQALERERTDTAEVIAARNALEAKARERAERERVHRNRTRYLEQAVRAS